MKDYSPRLDSVAHRAIVHIRSLPPNTERSTGEISQAINVDTNRLLHSLETLAAAGQLSRRRRSDHPKAPWFWRVPSATPPKDDPEPLPTGEAEELGTLPADPPAITVPTVKPWFRLWENGTLEMQRANGDVLHLTPDEATALTGWLVRGLRVRIDPTLL